MLTCQVQIKSILGIALLLLADKPLNWNFHTRHYICHTILPDTGGMKFSGSHRCAHVCEHPLFEQNCCLCRSFFFSVKSKRAIGGWIDITLILKMNKSSGEDHMGGGEERSKGTQQRTRGNRRFSRFSAGRCRSDDDSRGSCFRHLWGG